MKKISIVIPCYNEVENVELMAMAVTNVLQETLSQYDYEIIFIDNCYCEFVERKTPLEVGADIIVGSLIKNLGGGIAQNRCICSRKNRICRAYFRKTNSSRAWKRATVLP